MAKTQRLLLLLVLPVVWGATTKRNVFCKELPQETLEKILGAAYNEQYMSIEGPGREIPSKKNFLKRNTEPEPPFYVDEDYVQVNDAPAWTVQSHVGLFSDQDNRSSRIRRATKPTTQWKCESKVDWDDLGLDYFPRFLRRVKCVSKSCWYGRCKCVPRSFTVKVLKRIRGRCVEAAEGATVGDQGLPQELVEDWVWEKRPVSFCCDCVM